MKNLILMFAYLLVPNLVIAEGIYKDLNCRVQSTKYVESDIEIKPVLVKCVQNADGCIGYSPINYNNVDMYIAINESSMWLAEGTPEKHESRKVLVSLRSYQQYPEQFEITAHQEKIKLECSVVKVSE